MKDLEEKLLSLEQQDIGELREKNGGKEIRIWMDGAFDMMHYGSSLTFSTLPMIRCSHVHGTYLLSCNHRLTGHMNAFRQGRALGTHLVVGVNSDETITACKGPPVSFGAFPPLITFQ